MRVCTFCGHNDAPHTIRDELSFEIVKLIFEKGVNCFYVGNHGGFDSMVLNTLRKIKDAYPEIRYYVVLAYMPGEKEKYRTDDETPSIYPEGMETMPPRFCITYRNKWMVEQSDYLISYVRHDFGGAAATLKYAKSQQLQIISISDDE